MALKTDYQNDKFQGKRKWAVTTNDDETISLTDVTTYEVEGDIFNADDINATNTQVNTNVSNIDKNKIALQTGINTNAVSISSLKRLKTASFPASGWSASVPYIQTVSVAELTENDSPIIGLNMSDNPSAAVTRAREKAFGYVNRAFTGSGTLTLRCNISKPTTDFTVLIKGV